MGYSDERGFDTISTSSVDDAALVIDRFRAKDSSVSSATPVALGGKIPVPAAPPAPPSPWTSLNRLSVAAELLDIVKNPRRINQGPFNLCGPAAFWSVMASRHPKAFAIAATDLFDTGRGSVGGLVISPTQDLMKTDFPAIVKRLGATAVPTTPTEWMLLSALRNSTRSSIWPTWDGQPESSVSGVTLPGEVETWFNNTGMFSKVNNDASVVVPLPTTTALLQLGGGMDHLLLINANLMVPAGLGAPASGFFEKLAAFFTDPFPDHWIMLVNHVVIDASANTATFGFWTWGDTVARAVVGLDLFKQCCHGAVSSMTPGPVGDFEVPSGPPTA
jgi:hypothetical protein